MILTLARGDQNDLRVADGQTTKAGQPYLQQPGAGMSMRGPLGRGRALPSSHQQSPGASFAAGSIVKLVEVLHQEWKETSFVRREIRRVDMPRHWWSPETRFAG